MTMSTQPDQGSVELDTQHPLPLTSSGNSITNSHTMPIPASFPQFPHLPLELQRHVWSFAALNEPGRVISFGLSDPNGNHPWENHDMGHPDDYPFPWKHIMPGSRSVPALLQACHNAREVALKHFKSGFEILMDGYGWSRREGDQAPDEECSHAEDAEEFGMSTFWNPDRDLVFLSHQEESHGCHARSTCNANEASYSFLFDKKLRFLAMTPEVWERGDDNLKLDVKGLEIAFVVEEQLVRDTRNTHQPVGFEATEIEDVIDVILHARSEELTSQLRREADHFPWLERFDSRRRGTVIAVRSIEEAFRKMATWEPAEVAGVETGSSRFVQLVAA